MGTIILDFEKCTTRSTTNDLATVLEGQPYTESFTLQNGTRKALRFNADSGLRMSCGCASLLCDPQRIMPGECATVKVTLNTSGKSGPTAASAEMRWVDNESRMVPSAFSIAVDVTPMLALSPRQLEIGEDRDTAFVLLRAEKELVPASTEIVYVPHGISVTSVVDTADGARIGLKFSPDLRTNWSVAEVLFQAKIKDCSTPFSVALPVYSSYRPPLSVSPKIVMLRPNATDANGRFFVRFVVAASLGDVQEDQIRIRFGECELDCDFERLGKGRFFVRSEIPRDQVDIDNSLELVFHDTTLSIPVMVVK
ncbi:MAG: DUF1573 domain-containing protein [Lentisphaerae bacterium]|nr:DUF1573 domain-containing protein [Lentisphaerota bacterium]